MKRKHRILIVDDHRIFREGLMFVISQMSDFEVAGEASNGYIFLEMIDNVQADIVLMDISMPGIDGISATTQAIEKFPDLKIIALTMFCEKEYFNKMVNAGVKGFILKDSGKEELEKALSSVISGETYYSQKMLHNVIMKAGISHASGRPVNRGLNLTNSESEVLKLICQGFSTSQISEMLNLSFRTIENYKLDLMNKTGAKNAINLAVYAVKNHIVEI